jgi:hypothetical protein
LCFKSEQSPGKSKSKIRQTGRIHLEKEISLRVGGRDGFSLTSKSTEGKKGAPGKANARQI